MDMLVIIVEIATALSVCLSENARRNYSVRDV